MKKITVIGHFGFGYEYLDGQTVKTKTLTDALDSTFGEDSVVKIDTHGGKKKLLSLPFVIKRALKTSENILILPAHNGLKVIPRILVFLNRFYKRSLHYSVIGGWLPSYVKDKPGLAKTLKKLDNIYVETSTMANALTLLGFNNVTVMPNCKELTPISESELTYQNQEPYTLCTFSRVMKQKGIEDAINAVKSINAKHGRTVYSLDIYGQIDSAETEWFDSLKASFPSFVKYGGLVPFDKSVEILKNYFALLFPTRFFTEGIPGTVIDAYAAGVPVISAKWESFSDIIEDGVTGIGYEFGNADKLTQCLESVFSDPSILNSMKLQCLQASEKYLPENVIKILTSKF